MRRSVTFAVGSAIALAIAAGASAAPKSASPCVAVLVASSEETPKGGWGTTGGVLPHSIGAQHPTQWQPSESAGWPGPP